MHEAAEPLLRNADGEGPDAEGLSPSAKNAIRCAREEAVGLDNDYIGTEHLLLGLLHNEVGLVDAVWQKVTLERVLNESIALQKQDQKQQDSTA